MNDRLDNRLSVTPVILQETRHKTKNVTPSPLGKGQNPKSHFGPQVICWGSLTYVLHQFCTESSSDMLSSVVMVYTKLTRHLHDCYNVTVQGVPSVLVGLAGTRQGPLDLPGGVFSSTPGTGQAEYAAGNQQSLVSMRQCRGTSCTDWC